jgi:UDP-glucose 4-epimerase
MKILVTGGTDYISSHAEVELLAGGHDVFVIDNLCCSKASVLYRIDRITGRQPAFTPVDVRDRPAVRQLVGRHRFDAVMHFAGLKAIGESVQKPLREFSQLVDSDNWTFLAEFYAGRKSDEEVAVY